MYRLRAFCCLVLSVALRADGLIPPLTPAQAQQAATILRQFKTTPKGPFQQIRWFCKDGTSHTPPGSPCMERGGGIQHATRNDSSKKLSSWNIDTGTVIAAMTFDEFFDAKRDYYRLREIALEQYLRQIDDGWVDRRAFAYRGSRQIEDESAAGRDLLIRLLSNPDWTRANFFLALQTVSAVPHGADGSAVKRIRALAVTVAEKDSRFQPLRAKIHSAPGPGDLERVREFRPNAEAAADHKELLAAMEQERTSQFLPALLARLKKSKPGSAIATDAGALMAAVQSGAPDSLAQAAKLSLDLRKEIESSSEGVKNIELADALLAISDWAFQQEAPASATRHDTLVRAQALVHISTGAGLLSFRQKKSFDQEATALVSKQKIGGDEYLRHMRYLARSLDWCRATAAKDYHPVVSHYLPAEPKASQFVDHLLRGSPALSLARAIDTLSADAQRAAGIRHSFFGSPVSSAVMALNPGVALAPLARWREGALDPGSIYVIPETAADLTPVLGILSLDSGNALSHTQLLAANAGIPNATVPSALLPKLEPFAGKEVFYAVSPGGTVILRDAAELSPDDKALWTGKGATKQKVSLNTAKLRLDERRIRPLEEVAAEHVGVICGPKAGNLGQLKRFFPESVAPGLVVPFGAYVSQIDPALRKDVAAAFSEAQRKRDRDASAQEIRQFIGPKLDQFQERILKMPLTPEFEEELLSNLRSKFGPDGSYGVFVRSDTNAEDLPEFSGAGLNRTVANVVGERNVLAALRDVWASPFAERAYEWRARVLENADSVFPSVVILKTVAVDKSGVIATMDLESGDTTAITVNASEGIAAVVDGGVAESLLLTADGGTKLLQQARNPYRKAVRPDGGLINVPTTGSDTVLLPDEIRQLRVMVADVERKYPPEMAPDGTKLPWDIEFGFERGSLRLFQIRPLARFREIQTLERLSRLDAGSSPVEVSLDGQP